MPFSLRVSWRTSVTSSAIARARVSESGPFASVRARTAAQKYAPGSPRPHRNRNRQRCDVGVEQSPRGASLRAGAFVSDPRHEVRPASAPSAPRRAQVLDLRREILRPYRLRPGVRRSDTGPASSQAWRLLDVIGGDHRSRSLFRGRKPGKSTVSIAGGSHPVLKAVSRSRWRAGQISCFALRLGPNDRALPGI